MLQDILISILMYFHTHYLLCELSALEIGPQEAVFHPQVVTSLRGQVTC